MADQHDKLESRYRSRLSRKGYAITNGSPFVDYRPDIHATNSRESLFVEIEISATLDTVHTSKQLKALHKYLKAKKHARGVLVVPRSSKRRALFLIRMLFGDSKISVESL